MTNAPFAAVEDLRDIESLNHYREAVATGQDSEEVMTAIRHIGRDNARTPVQWDDGPQAGFTTGTPWIGVNPNHSWLNATAQYDDPHSVFNHYRHLIELRHNMPVVAHGSFTMLLADHPTVYAYERGLKGERLVVVANLSGSPAGVDLDLEAMELVQVNTRLRDAAASGPLVLAPWEARIYASAL
ncbi:Oligo-1,6-glucosidase [compost metagenome]